VKEIIRSTRRGERSILDFIGGKQQQGWERGYIRIVSSLNNRHNGAIVRGRGTDVLVINGGGEVATA